MNIQFDGSIYQNIGFWLSLAVIVSANYIELYSSKFKHNISLILLFVLIFIVSLFSFINRFRGAFIGAFAGYLFINKTRVLAVHYLALFLELY